MSEEKNYFSDTKEIEFDSLVGSLLYCSHQCEPEFPRELIRIIGEHNGLDLNEKIMCGLLSQVVDFKLEGILNECKEIKEARPKRMPTSERGQKGEKIKQILTKKDIEVILSDQGSLEVSRPSVYPILMDLSNDEKKIDEQFFQLMKNQKE